MSTVLRPSASAKPASAKEQSRRDKQRQTAPPKQAQRDVLMASVAETDKSPPHSKSKINASAIVSPYLTTTEAAAYLKLSRQFLEAARWRGDGSGPDYVRFGKSVRYIQSTLDAWMLTKVHSADKPIK